MRLDSALSHKDCKDVLDQTITGVYCDDAAIILELSNGQFLEVRASGCCHGSIDVMTSRYLEPVTFERKTND